MPLGKNQPASTWIHDFVHSGNSRFKGKSRAQRIKMALGAYYGKQNEESVATELRLELIEGKVSAHNQYKSLANWQAATLGMGFKHHSEPHVVHGNKHYAVDKTGNVRGNYSEKWKVGYLPKRIGEEAIHETRMPAGVIKQKTKMGNMSGKELADHFVKAASNPYYPEHKVDSLSVEVHARKAAWRHGHGPMSGKYWDKAKDHVLAHPKVQVHPGHATNPL